MTSTNHSELLFSYGTLQYEAVQISTFGRQLNGVLDTLTGYKLSMVKINNPDVVKTSGESLHPILTYTGKDSDHVSGTVFMISPEELQMAAQYEVDDYKRILVQLSSGKSAWVYVSAE